MTREEYDNLKVGDYISFDLTTIDKTHHKVECYPLWGGKPFEIIDITDGFSGNVLVLDGIYVDNSFGGFEYKYWVKYMTLVPPTIPIKRAIPLIEYGVNNLKDGDWIFIDGQLMINDCASITNYLSTFVDVVVNYLKDPTPTRVLEYKIYNELTENDFKYSFKLEATGDDNLSAYNLNELKYFYYLPNYGEVT